MDREQRMIVENMLDRSVLDEPLAESGFTIQKPDTWGADACDAATTIITAHETALRSIDPLVADLVDRESQRQREKIILIASKSQPHLAVLEALASQFTSLYAEGYPPARLRESSLEDVLVRRGVSVGLLVRTNSAWFVIFQGEISRLPISQVYS